MDPFEDVTAVYKNGVREGRRLSAKERAVVKAAETWAHQVREWGEDCVFDEDRPLLKAIDGLAKQRKQKGRK